MENAAFGGYKWQSHSYVEGRFPKVQPFLASIKWEALCLFASRLNENEQCTLDPQIAMGGRNVVRILNFSNGTRWIARIRLPPIDQEANRLVQGEVDCIKLVRELTSIPVPEIYGCSADPDLIGAPFILMEALQGNAAVDLNNRLIHPEHKDSFYRSLAEYQAETSSITFPKIGSPIRNPDGTYDVGPLPRLGGPFSTATEYLRAWAKHTPFYGGTNGLKEMCGIYGDKILHGVLTFPQRVSELAGRIAVRDNGPFPLIHPDFFHSNIIVDDDWKVLGVIDWEYAQSVPWETVEFPLTLSVCPRLIDAPWNYDENGVAKDEDTRAMIKDRGDFLVMVNEYERSKGQATILSDVLGDQAGQDLATAIRYYTSVGKQAFYDKVFDAVLAR